MPIGGLGSGSNPVSGRSVRLAPLICAFVAPITFAETPTNESATREPITVEDLSRFAIFGDPQTLDWDDEARPLAPVTFSSNGSRAAVLVRRGDVITQTNEARLYIYDTRRVRSDPRPLIETRLASPSNRQPIAQLHWLADNETLMFAGTGSSGVSQLYSFSTNTGDLRVVSEFTDQLQSFSASADGKTAVAVATQAGIPLATNPKCAATACRVEGTRLSLERDGGSPQTLVFAKGPQDASWTLVPRPEASLAEVKQCDDQPLGGISPNGRFLLRACVPRDQPSWWSSFRLDPIFSECVKRGRSSCAGYLVITDLLSGESRVVSHAPFRPESSTVLWGVEHFIVAGAFEAPTKVNGRVKDELTVLDIDPATLNARHVSRLTSDVNVVNATWEFQRTVLALETSGITVGPEGFRVMNHPKQWWRQLNREWRKVKWPKSPQSINTSQMFVTQSLNEPPKLWARSKAGEATLVLDPNPFLRSRRVGPVETLEWKTPDGKVWRGGLYFPPDFDPSRRYPVVLQTHGFNDQVFSMTGRGRNFTARALAARDILVLQIGENEGNAASTPQEWEVVQNGYESAIDILAERGLIDRDRVGVHGWSRTGPQLGFVITHSDYPIRSAVFTDSGDFGWWYYLLDGADAEVDALFGAAPFGAGLERWLETAPTFSMDRVRTPMLLIEGRFLGLAGLWDWYAGLRRLEKPVEYWLVPDGEHDFYQVGQRLKANQLVVDWFSFWLLGSEDYDPEKRDQYLRWWSMNEQLRGASSVPRPPLLDWSVSPVVPNQTR
jgi:hypothetical protein